MKKICLLICLCVLSVGHISFVGAQSADDPFVLIPEAENEGEAARKAAEELGKGTSESGFFERYNEKAHDLKDDVGGQFASGIMNRDTILTLLGRVVTFLANGALVVGAAMIIYAGYLYVASVFAGDYTSKANEAIKRAIIGIVIVIFSYAIVRIVLHAFL